MALHDALPAIRERQQPELTGDVVKALVRPEQQQHVARVQLELAHVFPKAPAGPRYADQGYAIAVQQAYGPGRAAGKPGRFRHHDLGEFQVAVIQHALGFADVFQLQRAERLVKALRARLDDEDVVCLDGRDPREPREPPALARQAHDLDVALRREIVEVADPLADHGRSFGYANLGDVVGEIEQVGPGVPR